MVQRAKVNEVQRLIRKIKQLNGKKGTQAQLDKNRRKADSLKKETEEIKVN